MDIAVLDYYETPASTRKPDMHAHLERLARLIALRAVMPFNSVADRTVQLGNIALLGFPAPAKGALSFMRDSGQYEQFDGSVWAPLSGEVIGANYFTGGDMAQASSAGAGAGAESSTMVGSWSGTVNFTWRAKTLFEVTCNGVVYQAGANTNSGTARLRKNTSGGQILWLYTTNIPANAGNTSNTFDHSSYVKNDTTSDVTCTLFPTTQRGSGGGASAFNLYGDANTPLMVTVRSLGPISKPANQALAGIAYQV